MPPVINDYAIVADLHRLNIQNSTISSIQGPPPVDLIALTYSVAKHEYMAGDFTLERVSHSEKAYHLCYNIYIRNQLLGFIYTDRTKKYGYNQQLRPLHVANEAFYTLDYGRVLADFLQVFRLEVANHSDIHIALDTQQLDLAQALGWYGKRPDKYQLIRRKNDKGLEEITSKDKATGKSVTTTYWNMGSKTIVVKMYNKSAELRKHPKQYVDDWHAAHGFDPEKTVYRIEVSIKANALKEYHRFAVTADGEEISTYRADSNNNALSKASKQTEITSFNIDMQKLNSPAYLSKLFQYFLPIDMRKRDASRPTNCTRISLIDFSIYGDEVINKTIAIRPTATTATKCLNILKTLVGLHRQTGDESFLAAARALAAHKQLTVNLDKVLARTASTQAAHHKLAA